MADAGGARVLDTRSSKRRKVDDTSAVTFKPPTWLVAAVKAASPHEIDALDFLLAEFTWGFDDAINVEFGPLEWWISQTAYTDSGSEKLYRFLTASAHRRSLLRAVFPPAELRKNGKFAALWRDLPDQLTKHDIYYEGFETSFHEPLERAIRNVLTNCGASDAKSLDADDAKREIAEVLQHIFPYYVEGSNTDSYRGLPYRCVYLPLAGIFWNEADAAAQRNAPPNLSYEDKWIRICDQHLPQCVSLSGFFDTASREAYLEL